MIRDEWKHKPDLYLKAIAIRCLNQEINITPDELDYAEKCALSVLYEKNLKITVGLPLAFTGEHVNGDMRNGHDAA